MQKPLAFWEFLPDFQSENGFDLTKNRRIVMRVAHCLYTLAIHF